MGLPLPGHQQCSLGGVVFNTLLDAGVERTINKFAGDNKVGGTAESLKQEETLQRDLENGALSNHAT